MCCLRLTFVFREWVLFRQSSSLVAVKRSLRAQCACLISQSLKPDWNCSCCTWLDNRTHFTQWLASCVEAGKQPGFELLSLLSVFSLHTTIRSLFTWRDERDAMKTSSVFKTLFPPPPGVTADVVQQHFIWSMLKPFGPQEASVWGNESCCSEKNTKHISHPVHLHIVCLNSCRKTDLQSVLLTWKQVLCSSSQM